METYKLIYTATGDSVTNKYNEELIYPTKPEAEKAAAEIGIGIYEERPREFEAGGFLYGTSTLIVSIEKIDTDN